MINGTMLLEHFLSPRNGLVRQIITMLGDLEAILS
jgi:hypothetical protein